MTTSSTSAASSTPAVLTTIASARASADGVEYVPVADCVDWLLDCFNAAEGDNVRHVITGLLPDFTHGNLRSKDSFVDALDQVEMAVQIGSLSDDLDLDPDPVG